MSVWQFCMLAAGLLGFLLARWQYKKSAYFSVQKQAVCGVYYAQELAGRSLENWEIKIVSGNHFSTYSQYASAKENSMFLTMPLECPTTDRL